MSANRAFTTRREAAEQAKATGGRALLDQQGNKRVVSRDEAERMEADGEVAAWLGLLNDGTLVAVPVG